jgi:hypothetical protein
MQTNAWEYAPKVYREWDRKTVNQKALYFLVIIKDVAVEIVSRTFIRTSTKNLTSVMGKDIPGKSGL